MPEKKVPTFSYAPHQLRAVKKFLRQGGEDAKARAAKMSGLSAEVVDLMIEHMPEVAAAAKGVEDAKPQQEVRQNPAPPAGPEGR